MNPSGSEFTLRVAICDLVERLKRMQHKCSYLEECRNQLVKEVIRLRIQNEWLAKQMHDMPSGSGPPVGVAASSSLPSPAHPNPNSVAGAAAALGQASAAHCFCNSVANSRNGQVGSSTAQPSSQHHHPSLVNSSSSSSSSPNILQHQPNCPFVLAASESAATTTVLLTGDTPPGLNAVATAYFINGDNSEHFNACTASGSSQRPNNCASGPVNNNTVSDESLHLMNILNQFEQEDNNASKENSIKNLTLQMLKELETEMRTGKLKNDLLKLVNTGPPKKSLSNPDDILEHYDETSKQPRPQEFTHNNNNHNGMDKSLESLDDSGAFGRSKSKPEMSAGWSVNKDSRGIDTNNKLLDDSSECIDLTELLNEDELMSLVSLIRRDIKALQQDVHTSTERLGKIKQKNEDEKFRFYFQKQIKSEPVPAGPNNQSISQSSSIAQVPASGTENSLSSGGNLNLSDRNGLTQTGGNHKTNNKHS